MATIIGTNRNDVLIGTVADDLIFGLAGNDMLTGEAGNDLLDGGASADFMRGGTGNDTYRVDNVGDRVVEGGTLLPLTRVSSAADGVQANDTSFNPAISGDGRFVAFGSLASNLVLELPNVVQDIFVKDLQTGAIVRASTSANGVQGNDTSVDPSITADGRLVAFASGATNLVPNDLNFVADVFVKDLTTGAIVRASTSASGVEANNSSSDAAISAGARFVAFGSLASNLTVGDRNVASDIYVKDLLTGALVIASSDSSGISSVGGSAQPSISGDGQLVAFSSRAFDLVPGFNGAVPGILLKDLSSGTVALASTAADGRQANDSSFEPSLSTDGHFLAFGSLASNLVLGDTNAASDIFVKDLQTGAIVRASTAADGTEANNASDLSQISPDGHFVVFRSFASNLVPDDTNAAADTFVKDLVTGAIARVSVGANGQQANDNSFGAAISADAGVVAFLSSASNLLPLENNVVPDVFAVSPLLALGSGVDTVEAAVSFALPANVENLTLVGAANINGTGNALANILAGNVGANALFGGLGNDGLFGAPGNDNLDGGDGFDYATYLGSRSQYGVLIHNGQVVVASAAEGLDRLTSIESLHVGDQVLPTAGADSALQYIASYADLMAAFGANAAAGFQHFIASGYAEGRAVTFDGLQYIASYGDLINAFGVNADAGANHYIQAGRFEVRSTSFDGFEYIASYGDLINAFGANADADAGANHFITQGRFEGRSVTFDGLNYIASYGDLINAFGANADAGAQHYITAGFAEHRVADFDAAQYLANYADLQAAFGTNAEAATIHYITNGYFEGRTDHAPA
ncbi:MAG: hypothetical protein ABWY07_06230 [Burkholderiales bacterium]